MAKSPAPTRSVDITVFQNVAESFRSPMSMKQKMSEMN